MLNRNNKIKIYISEFSARDTLKETMEHYHITQAELASRINVNQSYISDILNRKKFMSSEVALKIEKATVISAVFLLKYEELDNIFPYDWAIIE